MITLKLTFFWHLNSWGVPKTIRPAGQPGGTFGGNYGHRGQNCLELQGFSLFFVVDLWIAKKLLHLKSDGFQ